MALSPLPLRIYPTHQDDLLWRAAIADGEMGRRSNMDAFIRRMEGGGGTRRHPDLLTEPEEALRDIYDALNLKAATRAKRIDEAMRRMSWHHRQVLDACYWRPAQRGLEAWPGLENVVALSDVAVYRWQRSKARDLDLGEWLVKLSARAVGTVRDGIRSRPKANETERAHVLAIGRDCESMLTAALCGYVDSIRRIAYQKGAA